MFYRNRQTKVGLIVTMSSDTTWPAAIVDKVEAYLPKARATLKQVGMEVYDCGSIARTSQEMGSQAEELRAEGVHVLVIYVGTWTYSSTSVIAGMKSNVPVVVWASDNIETFGIVGGSIVRGALDEVGIKSYLVYGDFEDQRTRHELDTLCRGIAGATKLRGMVYGEGGSRCMGMYTGRIDPSEWMRRFGVDVDGFEQVDVIARAKTHSNEEAEEFLDWMREEFGGVEAKKEAMLAQIKMYFALREIIEEKGYDFIAVKCLPELPSRHTTFCVAHALLNDTSDDGYGETRAFVSACEADANGALTMQIMNNITGGTTMFTDVLYYDYEENMVRMCNCGSQPTDFARSRKDVTWVAEGLQEFNWLIGGACPRYVGKPGKLTLARLSRINGDHVMLIITAEALDMPLEKIKETNPQQPHVFARLNCKQENFLKSLRANHVHVVYGDIKQELITACQVLDIKPILPE